MTNATANETTAEVTPIGLCTCAVCGRDYHFENDHAECSDECPDCAALAEAELQAEQEWEERVSDAEDAVAEAESDLDGLLTELADLQARIREARSAVRSAERDLTAARE